jgi:hypothetical protein
MEEIGLYYDEGKSVMYRRGLRPVVITEIAVCISARMASRIANRLNKDNRNSRFAAPNAAEKGEQNHGNRNSGTTENESQPADTSSR